MCDHSMDGEITAAESATDEKAIGEVWEFCEFSLLHTEHNQSYLSLTALDNTLKWFCKMKGAFQEQKMLKAVKVKEDKQLARKYHQ